MSIEDARKRREAPPDTPSDLGSNAATKDISAALTALLADVFALYVKTKNFHWHISGPHFRDYHLLLDEQAAQISAMTEEIAERAREIGGTTIRSTGHIARVKHIEANDADFVSPEDMLAELKEDNFALTQRMRHSELRRRPKGVQMMVDGSEPVFEVGLFQIKVDQEAEDDRFYQALVPFDFFDDVVRRDRYRPLPNDWVIAVTDVSHSTEAIEQGRYREVNTAGAAVLAAVSNALPDLQFPFTFGGDGASFAAPGAYSSIIKDTLAKTAAWAEDALGLTLRVAVIPIADIRAQHLDVLVSRFAPSSNVTYAMFAGGGLAWAERKLKQGDYAVARAPMGVTADLTGLSCRFAPISTKHGVILSLIVVPRDDPTSFVELITGAPSDAPFR